MTNKLTPVKRNGSNVVTMELKLDQNFPIEFLQNFLDQFKEDFESFQASMIINSEKAMSGIGEVKTDVADVKNIIKSKHISPQDLAALEAIVSDKAEKYVDKKGHIQTDISMFLNFDEASLRDAQKMIKREHGRIKQKIWVELNKEALERKGTDPKNTIKDTQVELAFDFVRKWGGFTL